MTTTLSTIIHHGWPEAGQRRVGCGRGAAAPASSWLARQGSPCGAVPGPELAPDLAAQRVGRQPDHPVGMSVTRTSTVTRPGVVDTVTLPPSAAPYLGRGRRRHHAPRPRGPCPARNGSPSLHPAGVEQLVPGGQHRPARPGATGRPAARGAAARRRRVPAPARRGSSSSRRARRASGQAQVDVHLVGDPAQHLQVGLHRRAPRTARRTVPGWPPSSRTCSAFHHRRHRQHHVGAVGDRADPQLQADDERRGLRARSSARPGRPGQLGRPRR